MRPAYRILVVDNSSHVRESLELMLTAKGYQVFVAASPDEARRLVKKDRIHLALVDIRLEDDDDPQDTSGLELAASLDHIVARIVITGYDSQENMRRALRPIVSGAIPAYDYVLKKDGPVALLGAIERACQDEIFINWTLEFDWDGISAEAIGAEVELEQADLTREALADEVEELLRRLFCEEDYIIVSPLLAPARAHASSQSGAVVLKVQPHYLKRGFGAPVVCKVGARQQIKIEADNYARYVKGFISGYCHTSLEQVKYTHYLGGVLYSMFGTTLDAARDFHDFYQRSSVAEIGQVLNRLFKDVCHYWLTNKQRQDRANLTQFYRDTLRLTDEKLQDMLTRYFPRQQNQTLQFEGLPGIFTNPVHWIEGKELKSRTYYCVTHGDLHSHNIFVDEYHQVWLIDFGRTGEGHALRDIIELETDIKFALLETVDLTALYHLEVALLQPNRLDEPLVPPKQITDPGIQKALQVVGILRRMATTIIKCDDAALPYYQGLLYQTLNMVRLKKVDIKKKQHALLAATLLCERLDLRGRHWNRAPVQATDETLKETSERKHPTKLHGILIGRFNIDGLRTLCFELGVDYDTLGGEGKDGKARELVLYLAQHKRIPELVETGKRLRPDIKWDVD